MVICTSPQPPPHPELLRFLRTAFQSVLAPVLTTSLYFIVFGAAIGGRMPDLGGVDYGAFIIPGLLMLTLLGETTSNSSFGIYMPRFTGTIYELLSAPVGVAETLIGFVGAAMTKSLILAAIILVTALLFALPLIRKCKGAAEPLPQRMHAIAGKALPAVGSRREFVRGRVTDGTVVPVGSQDSSALGALAAANCLIERTENSGAVAMGDPVRIYPLGHG